jgi:4-amino-4-deoxy-L-arabinose transferase-like glycosyltransferase
MASRLRAALPLAGLVMLGAALRFYALDFGMTYPHARPDEGTAIGHAVDILHGDLNPHFFNWPSLTLYLFAAAYAIAKTAGVTLTGAAHVLIARGVVALAGTATIAVVASIGRRLGGIRTGALAGLFLAVAPLHVRDSHFAMTDVLMTLLVTLSVALMMRGVETRRTGLAAAAGAAGGLATSTKYSAGVIAVIAAAAPGVASAALFLASWVAGFLVATPFALLDYTTFSGDVTYERAHLSGGHTVQLARGWLYHLQTTLPYGLGIALFVAAVAGVPVVLSKYGRKALVPVLFAAAFYISIGAGRTVFFRYALPLVPMACVFAAVAVHALAAWIAGRATLAQDAVAVAIAAAVAAPSLYQSVQVDRLLAREDSRAAAAAWLASQLRPEDSVHDSGGNYTRLHLPGVAFHEWRYDPVARSFGDPRGATPDWIVLYESPLAEYTAPPDSLRDLVNAGYSLAYRMNGVPAAGGSGVYDRQDAFFLPIAGFKGVARPGPTVLIYRRRT